MKIVEFDTVCCICGTKLHEFGCNPAPIVQREGARCCTECDREYVIPARCGMKVKIPQKSRKIENNEFEKQCCICGCQVEGIGHNPSPVIKRKGAVCCNMCDANVVLPARLKEMRAKDRAKHK